MTEWTDDLQATAKRALQGVNHLPEGMILVDLQGNIIFLNSAASRLTGWAVDEAMGRHFRKILTVINAMTREPAWDPFDEVLSDHQSYSLLPNSVLITKQGTEIPIEDSVSPFNDEGGAVAGVIILFRDVSLSRWRLAKAVHRAQHDVLTSLPNRSILHQRILSALAELGPKSGMVCVLYIDLDKFKSVNDRFGHTAGDLLLQVVASRIASCLGGSDLVSRVGGDEFVVMLSAPSGIDELQSVVSKLLEEGRKPIGFLGTSIAVCFSIGISLREENSTDVVGLLNDADLAACRAKSLGGDRAQLFEPSFRENTDTDRVLQFRLAEALRLNQFVLQYQPIIDCKTQKMVGLEALVRWQQPDGSLLHPASFISVAERSGLIVELGHAVLKQALEQTRLWLKQGLRVSFVTVNVSAVELLSKAYVDTLRDLLASHEYESNSLVLELTESAMLGVEQQQSLLPAIRDLKVRVAMDDFGIGYSNIGYLKNFIVDIVKLDRSFIAGISGRHQDRALIKAMIAMARSIEAVVTAEGVETAEQARFLRDAGCCQVQGNFYSPPAFPEAVPGLLERQWTTLGSN